MSVSVGNVGSGLCTFDVYHYIYNVPTCMAVLCYFGVSTAGIDVWFSLPLSRWVGL